MKKNTVSKILLIIAIIAVLVLITVVAVQIVKKVTRVAKNPVATIQIQDMGTIKVELYPDKAPNTVSNFIRLANRGYYNGLSFHRVIPGFMIQGGDLNGDGSGSPTLSAIEDTLTKEQEEAGKTLSSEYAIEGEMIANNFNKNTIKMQRGVIAMGHGDYTKINPSLTKETYNSAGSQFFILHADTPAVNGVYAGFGKVIEGMDIVDKIANLDVTYRSSELAEGAEAPKDEAGNTLTADMPLNKPIITKVTVETYGIDYGMPDIMDPFNYYDYIMQYYSSLYGNN